MFEINSRKDIIIPFSNIGEDGWEKGTKAIIEAYADMWDEDPKTPKTEVEIKELEQRVGADLPAGLKTFYKTFGIAAIGEELLEFEDMGWLKDIWADEPEYGPNFSETDKELLPYLVTFSDYRGNGNMFCFHSETKEVYYYDHESEPYLSRMFATVDDYIKGCLIYVQAEIAGPDVDSEDAAKWAEKIVTKLFGKDIIRKWQY